MTGQYVTFEQAKWLKEIGFDVVSNQSLDLKEGRGGIIPYFKAYIDYSLLHQMHPSIYKDVVFFDNISVNSSLFGSLESYYNNIDNTLPIYHAPEQWQVVEWLRVNHGIWVNIECDCYGELWYAKLLVASKERWSDLDKRHDVTSAYRFLGEYKSPQEAYSSAFDYLKKKNLL
jgi:hypothetical protein